MGTTAAAFRDLHPRDQRTLLWIGGAIAGVVAVLMLVSACLPDGQGWTAKVIIKDAESVCVLAANGSKTPEGSEDPCFRRGSEDVKVAWSDLDVGDCVGMRQDGDTLQIKHVSGPEAC